MMPKNEKEIAQQLKETIAAKNGGWLQSSILCIYRRVRCS